MSESSTATLTPTVERNRRPSSRKDGRAAALMIAPNMIMFTIFIVIPIIAGIYLSFTTWTIGVGSPKWVGLQNYKAMFNDPVLGIAIGNTLKFLFYGVVPTIILGLGLALLINVRFRGVGIVRSLYLVPAAMSLAASAIVWRFFFLAPPPVYGLFDWIYSKLGIALNDGLQSSTYSLPSLDMIGIWLSLPVATILYLAALQRISPSVIEAATIDGAGPLRRIRYIIWPGVRYMTILVAIFTLLQFTNASFDLVNILTPTGGYINFATTTLIWYIFHESFGTGLWGYGAALSVLLIAMTFSLLGVLWLLSRIFARRA